MTFLNRCKVTLAAVLVILAGTAVVATPASANPTTSCLGRVCVFNGYTMTSPSYYWTGSSLAVGQCYTISPPLSGQVKGAAAWLGSGYIVSFFSSSNCYSPSLVTAVSYSSGRGYGNCKNTDYWGGVYGSPAVWVTANSSCTSPLVAAFRVNFG